MKHGFEAFFGTNPIARSTGLTQLARNGNNVTFQHRNATTPLRNVTGSYEWSPDMFFWYPSGGQTADGTMVTTTAAPNVRVNNTTTVT